MKQHYVPQVYLREFTNSKKHFYKLNIKDEYPSIEIRTPASVCYLPDYYTIRKDETMNEFGITDRLFLEKKFKNFEDKYVKILKSVKIKKTIDIRSATILIDGLFSMKTRNPYMQKNFITEESVRKSFVNSANRLKKEAEIIFSKDITEVLKKAEEKYFSDDQNVKDMYLQTLLSEHTKGRKIIELIKSFLTDRKWIIYDNRFMSHFITSDNPGFCIDENNKIHNTKFGENFEFYFPLTPQYCLMISNKEPENILFPKPLYFKFITPDVVDMINRATIVNCNKEIYSNSENILKKGYLNGIFINNFSLS